MLFNIKGGRKYEITLIKVLVAKYITETDHKRYEQY